MFSLLLSHLSLLLLFFSNQFYLSPLIIYSSLLFLCLVDVTHYCSLLLPQRPEFADFKSLFQSDDSVFGNSRRSPGCDGMTVKRTICDVNSFDCENSDSDGEDVFLGYKTPKVENNFDTVAAINTSSMWGHSVNNSTSRRISPSASGSLSPSPTSPTSVCDSAYVLVRHDHGVDGEKDMEKRKSRNIGMGMGVGVDGEKSDFECSSEDVNQCNEKSVALRDSNSNSDKSVSVTGNRIQTSNIEPFEYNRNQKNIRSSFSFYVNDDIDYSNPY